MLNIFVNIMLSYIWLFQKESSLCTIKGTNLVVLIFGDEFKRETSVPAFMQNFSVLLSKASYTENSNVYNGRPHSVIIGNKI